MTVRKILVVDEHAIVRKGVTLILKGSLGIGVICEEASCVKEAEQKIASVKYDMVLLDIYVSGGNGLESLKKLHNQQPKLPILILSMFPEDSHGIRALTLGAVGYLTKKSTSEELIMAVERVLSGGRYVSPSLAERLAAHLCKDSEALPHERLSDREFQVLHMIGGGQTPTQIACALLISVKTAKAYRSKVLQKMELNNSAELMKYVLKNNIIT